MAPTAATAARRRTTRAPARTYARGAAAWGPYSAGMIGDAYNPRTGAYGQTRQSVSPYGRWGSSVVTRGDDWARTFSAAGESGTTLRGFETSGGRGGVVARGEDNTYVGRDGNVYRRDDSGWSKHENGGWNPVDTPERPGTADGRATFQDRAAAGGGAGAAGNRAGTFDQRARTGDVTGRLNQDARARAYGNSQARASSSYRSSGAGVRSRGGGYRRR